MSDLFQVPRADELDFEELAGTKYTPESGVMFLAVLSTGATPLKTAASRIGVDVKTVRSWRERCPAFASLVDAVMSARTITYNDTLHNITLDPDHKDQAGTARWLLERADPGTYAPRQRIDVGPANMTRDEQHEALVERFTDPGEAVEKALREAGWKR